MQKLFLPVLLTISLAGFLRAQEAMTGNKETGREVLKLEQDMVPTLQKGGSIAADWWEHYNSDDIAYVGGDGHMLTKAQVIDEWQRGVRKTSSVIHDDFRVHAYGNTVVVTYRGRETGKETGRNPNKRSEANRTTEVWVKQGGAWQRVVHHVTPVETQ